MSSDSNSEEEILLFSQPDFVDPSCDPYRLEYICWSAYMPEIWIFRDDPVGPSQGDQNVTSSHSDSDENEVLSYLIYEIHSIIKKGVKHWWYFWMSL